MYTFLVLGILIQKQVLQNKEKTTPITFITVSGIMSGNFAGTGLAKAMSTLVLKTGGQYLSFFHPGFSVIPFQIITL